MTNQEPSKEREFTGQGMARIFGAPISWIALFGALMGALSLVPMLFYPFGGGFASAGMVIFGPISGVILGPGAGFIAGLIGGVIGMFISPASYPLGLVDVFFSGALLPLVWGLVHPRYRKFFIPISILNIIATYLIPYVIPGPAGGFDPLIDVGRFSLAIGWVYVGLAVYLFAWKPVWKAMQSPKQMTRIIATIIYMIPPAMFWMAPWIWSYWLLLHYPFEMAVIGAMIDWWSFALPLPIITGIICALIVQAMEQTGLQRVKGSILDHEGFGG